MHNNVDDGEPIFRKRQGKLVHRNQRHKECCQFCLTGSEGSHQRAVIHASQWTRTVQTVDFKGGHNGEEGVEDEGGWGVAGNREELIVGEQRGGILEWFGGVDSDITG